MVTQPTIPQGIEVHQGQIGCQVYNHQNDPHLEPLERPMQHFVLFFGRPGRAEISVQPDGEVTCHVYDGVAVDPNQRPLGAYGCNDGEENSWVSPRIESDRLLFFDAVDVEYPGVKAVDELQQACSSARKAIPGVTDPGLRRRLELATKELHLLLNEVSG